MFCRSSLQSIRDHTSVHFAISALLYFAIYVAKEFTLDFARLFTLHLVLCFALLLLRNPFTAPHFAIGGGRGARVVLAFWVLYPSVCSSFWCS